MEQKFGKNSIDIEALREFCEREGVKGQESDIYKIQNLKYKQQLSALFFDDADFLYLVVFFYTR